MNEFWIAYILTVWALVIIACEIERRRTRRTWESTEKRRQDAGH